MLDHVFMFNGTMIIVTDDPSSMPDTDAIGSSLTDRNQPPQEVDWQVLSHRDAASRLGPYGGRYAFSSDLECLSSSRVCRIHGVTYMSYDASSTSDAYTLLSLHRLYSTVPSHNSTPPHRLFFPTISTFSDPAPDPDDDAVIRKRSNTGIHPYTLKAAYPTLSGALFSEDFADFSGLDIPMLLDRVVIADRAAAARYGSTADLWSGPFTLSAPRDWFDGVQRNLARYFGEGEGKGDGKKEVTYLVRQGYAGSGARLRAEDHKALLEQLKNLQKSGYKVNVIDESSTWAQRMKAVVRSTVRCCCRSAYTLLALKLSVLPSSWCRSSSARSESTSRTASS